MSDRLDLDFDNPADEQAALFVLGLLSDQEKNAFEQALVYNPELQQRVQDWESILHESLTHNIAPQQPPEQVLNNIENALSFDKRPFWRRLFQDQMPLAFATLIILFCLPFILLHQNPELTGSEITSAQVTGEAMELDIMAPDDSVAWVVQARFEQREVMVKTQQQIPTMPGRHCRIWMLDQDGNPVLVGTLPHHGKAMLTIPERADKTMTMENELILTIDDMSVSSDIIMEPDNISQKIPWQKARKIKF